MYKKRATIHKKFVIDHRKCEIYIICTFWSPILNFRHNKALYVGWNKLEHVFLEITYNFEIWPAGGAGVQNYTLKNCGHWSPFWSVLGNFMTNSQKSIFFKI